MRGEFTEGKALTDEEIRRAGISREGTLGSIGYRIGRNAGETVISNMRNGTIDERQALWIADFAPGSDKVQSAGVRLAIEGASKGEILARMEAEQALLNMQDEMGLSGGTDLFGGALDNDEFNNFAAKYVNRKRNSLGQDISYLNKLVGKKLSKEQAKRYGINIKDPEGLRKALDKLRLQQQEWQNPWVRRELMDEIRDAWKKENPIISGSGELTDSKGGTDGSDSKGGSDGTGGASMSVTAVKRGGKEPPVFKMLDLYHKRDLRGESFTVKEAKEKKLFDEHGIMQAANGVLIDGTSFAVTAMHASPHWIQDKFRLDKIGSGEGAQVFGSGMYFTESEGVNDHYLDQFKEENHVRSWKINGKRYTSWKELADVLTEAIGDERAGRFAPLVFALRGDDTFEIGDAFEHLKAEEKYARRLIKDDFYYSSEPIERAKKDLQIIPKIREWLADKNNKIEYEGTETIPAYNYRVEIDAEEGELFYWDDLMTDESNAGALERIRNSPVVEVRELAEAIGANTGEKFYWALADKMREKHGLGYSRKDKALAARYASEALLASGIKGHKYADGFTRGKARSKRDYNEVVFDMDAIRITHVARGNRDWKPYVPREEPGGASMSVVIPPRRICRTRQEALATVGGRGGSLILENRFLNLKAVFNSKSKGKFAHKDSLGRTFEALQPSGMSDEDIKTAHFSAYGNIVELFANAERMKYERAYKDKEVRKGFLHVYSPFELEGMGEKFEANIELMIFKEKGKTPMAYLLNVSLAPAAGQKGRGAGFPNLPIYLSGEIKSDFPDIVKREEEKNYGGSFSVIGPRAKTFSKYVDKAFLGRDDGKMRAEIDASQARLKGAWTAPKDLDRLATPGEKKKLDELRHAWDEWQKLAHSRKPEELAEKQALQKQAAKLEKELEGLGDRMLKELGYDFKNAALPELLDRGGRFALLGELDRLRNDTQLSVYKKYERKLGEVLDYPELFDAYPELAEMEARDRDLGKGYYGSYDQWTHIITINETLTPEERRSALLHEIQHAIQDIEGFAAGSSVGAAGDKARRIQWAREKLKDYRWELKQTEAYPEEMKDMDRSALKGARDKLLADYTALGAEHLRKTKKERRSLTDEERKKEAELWDSYRDYDSLLSMVESKGKKNAREVVEELKKEIKQTQAQLRGVHGVRQSLSDYELYRRTPGEIESRNVQERRNWTAEQRQ
ncbi:MAG: hypothetical protein LUG84_07110 [Akkermansiaceae bacterium]|nr:hypothetical protein [Akkermansiaceae bacterium]